MQKIRFYLISLNVLSWLGIIALVYVLNAFSPERTGNVIFFYVLVGLTAFAITTLIGMYLRKWFGQRELLNSYVLQASRQGFWLALILVTSMLLAHLGLFNSINAGLLILTFVFFESYLLTVEKNNDRQP